MFAWHPDFIAANDAVERYVPVVGESILLALPASEGVIIESKLD